ncbi:MAG: O-antigen ligase family protein [Actinomycetota bacterium]|nr:O-antigen ligase family protein [Actinomycetota bacterium]
MIEAAAVVGALGGVAVLLPRSRLAIAGGLAALAAAELTIGREIIPGGFSAVVSTPIGIAALLLAVAAIAGGAAAFARFPSVVPVFLLAAAPFRVSIRVGEESAFLLVPLYAVLAAAAAALVVRLVRENEPTMLPRVASVPCAAFVALAAVSTLWAHDLRGAGVELAFFLFPFTALVAVAGRAPLRPWSARALATTLVALGCLFALVGLWQVGSGNLFFAPDIEVANAYTSYDRVTSLFNDPSIYGRHLALALVVVVLALWLSRIPLALGAGLVALLWSGLYFSYSQSSMLALFVGVLAVTIAVSAPRVRWLQLAGAVALVLAVAVAVGVLAGGSDQPLGRLTSGRSELVADTARVIRDHPLIGVGIGNEARASDHGERPRRRSGLVRTPSHTTPLTVAAELGIAGILLYVLLLAGVARLLVLARARDAPLALGLGAALVVLVVHSLFYSGFFEDPLMWGAVAVGAAALAAPARVVSPVPTPTPARAPIRPWSFERSTGREAR